MSDWFYFLVYFIGCQPMWLTSRPVVLHRQRVPAKGPFLLISTHFSPYDVAVLIYETPRVLDFVSIIELFRHPVSRWFFSWLKAMPLDRGRIDSTTVREIVRRLKAGRAVILFPEGNLRTEETSVLNGGRMKLGVGRIAEMANVPIIPCVLVGARAYHTFRNWLPFKRIRYGLIYGEPIILPDKAEAEPERFEPRLRQALLSLHEELKLAMNNTSSRRNPSTQE